MAMREIEGFVAFLGEKKADIERNGQVTPAMQRFIELDKQKTEVKEFFEQYNEAVKSVVAEIGIGSFFQDTEGTVYKTVKPSGTFVHFVDFAVDRTRREGEAKGSLAMKEAKEAGFTLPETGKAVSA